MRKATSLRFAKRAACGLVLLLAATILAAFAAPASAAVVNYYVTASNGVAIPGDGTTNVTGSYSNQIDRVTLFNTTNGSSLVTGTRTSQWNDSAWYRMVDVYLPADYPVDTQIAANAQFFMGVSGTWDGWRVTLYSYNPGTGASVQLNQQTLGTGTGAQTLTVNFANVATTIPAGYRLRVLIEVDRDNTASTNLLFNAGGANQASYLRVNETPSDSTAPTTSLSSSPPAPDGDSGWFKSPVTITLSAVDPEGSPTTIYYRWNSDPYGVYAGGFSALSGTNTLWYYSTDAIPNTETAKSQAFKVDSAIVAPTITTPTGAGPPYTPVQGTIDVDATASDAVSGVNYVAFYYFAWNGSSWDAVGTQVGGNETTPVSGSTYRVSWNTALVADGRYKLQAQLRDVAGSSAFSPAQYVLVDNVGPTTAITTPAAGSAIRGAAVQIRGTASDANLTSWTLEIKPLSSGSWGTLAAGSTSVTDAVLHTLNTTSYADGQYQFRLTAVDGIANSSIALQTPVTIDNAGPVVTTATPIEVDTVDVRFLEALNPASISPTYFTIAGLTVSGATLLSDGVTVRLTTSAQTIAAPYTVVVKTTTPSVTDVAGNLVQAPATAAFAGYDPANDVTPPTQPGAPLAYSGHGRNSLAWGPSIAPDLAGYNLYRDTSAAGSFTTKVNAALLTTTTYDDTGYGTHGIVYYYKVTAVDRNGNESVKSPASHTELVRIDQNVGVGGAGLQSTNGEVAINVPGAALAAPISLRVDERSTAPSATAVAFVSPEYFFEPHGQTFASPVTITVKYSPGAVDESTIKLVYYDGSKWRPVEGGSVVNQVQKTVTGAVSHFSSFAAAAVDATPPAAPTVDPADATTGFPVNGFVVLTFGEDMDAGTLTNDKVQIRLGGVGGTVVSAETVVLMSDLKKVYIYPDRMLDISQGYTVWVSGSVTDLAGNPLGTDFTSTFTTAATGVTPHGTYSTSSNLCRNCHVVHGATGPKIFTEATEKQVCYACHDGTGSSYNVKTADNTSPYAWDFAEATIGSTTKKSYHPVPASLTHTWVDGTTTNTGVTMLCSNCHNAHSMTGTGQRFLAVKKLDPGYTGTYGAKTGKDFCWTCHNTTSGTSAGYVSSAAWGVGTGFDHKTYYPTGDTSHNKSTGSIVMAANPRVPAKENIACKGCHSEHGSTNSKLIAEDVNNGAATFDSTTATGYNTTYNPFCGRCHSTSGLGGFSWPGNAGYDTSGHGSSTSTKDLAYSPPVAAVTQTLQTKVCKQCHEPHGTGDANGAFLNLNRYFEEGVCYVCHNTTGNPTGAKNMATVFTRTYRHDLTLSATGARKHDLNQEYANSLNSNAGLSGGNRHVECTDCHNTHVSNDTVNSGLHTKGSAAVSQVLEGVWGVAPTNGAIWSQPSTWSWATAKLYPAAFEYQVCLKCHSAAAYGGTPPSRTQNSTRGTSYWPISTYTDQAKEFNPNNASYHAVWGASKASGSGTYVNGWTSTSRMYCSDCHRSDTAGDPIGSHGSGTPFMLGGNTTPANSRYVTGPNNGARYADTAARNADFTLCFNCHDPNFANTGFSGMSNLHTNRHNRSACTNCHVAVPHGWQRDHLLVYGMGTADPAPYNDHVGQGYGLPSTMTWRTSGNWNASDCHNGTGVGTCD
ncbi:MAG: cytochrome c3 family protein [Thermoleophilia bacterium]